MALMLVLLLSTLLMSTHTPGGASPSCPVSCRCYSLTVECGSTGLKDIPKHVPQATQVGSLLWDRTSTDIPANVTSVSTDAWPEVMQMWSSSFCLLSIQTIFLQDNVIGQIRRQDLILLRHLHYLYLQVHTQTHTEVESHSEDDIHWTSQHTHIHTHGYKSCISRSSCSSWASEGFGLLTPWCSSSSRTTPSQQWSRGLSRTRVSCWNWL